MWSKGDDQRLRHTSTTRRETGEKKPRGYAARLRGMASKGERCPPRDQSAKASNAALRVLLGRIAALTLARSGW